MAGLHGGLRVNRLGRRRLLRGAALLSGSVAFLAACGGNEDKPAAGGSAGVAPGTNTGGAAGSAASATTAAQATPKPGGVIRSATITQAPHFSPFHPGADPSYVNTWRRVQGYYDPLWNFKSAAAAGANPADRMVLRLAEKVEQPDESTYIVKLRAVTFHNREPANGRRLTAEDIKANIDFLSKPPATGGTFLQSGKDLKSVTAVDESTVRFQTFGPRAFFFENGASIATGRPIVPKEMLDEERLKRSIPVGTGPYEYKGHSQGSIEEVKRFDGYRLKPLPYIDEKKLTFVPDNAAIEAAFRSNQIDAMSFTDIKQRDSVKKDLGARIGTKSFVTTTGMCLLVNVNRAPWNDIRVREAIYRALDVDRVINVVYFGDQQRSWYFSPASITRNPVPYDKVKQFVGYDPKKAADLLKASGMDLSKEYDFMVPVEAQTWVDSGKLFAEDLAAVGLKTRVNPIVRNIYLQRGGPKPGDFDITMSVFLDYQYMKTKSGTFWDSASLQDPEVDALVEKIEQTVDVKARDVLWEEVQMMLARKYSNLMPLIVSNAHYAWYSHIKGWDDSFDYFSNWQDKLWIDRA